MQTLRLRLTCLCPFQNLLSFATPIDIGVLNEELLAGLLLI